MQNAARELKSLLSVLLRRKFEPSQPSTYTWQILVKGHSHKHADQVVYSPQRSRSLHSDQRQASSQSICCCSLCVSSNSRSSVNFRAVCSLTIQSRLGGLLWSFCSCCPICNRLLGIWEENCKQAVSYTTQIFEKKSSLSRSSKLLSKEVLEGPSLSSVSTS